MSEEKYFFIKEGRFPDGPQQWFGNRLSLAVTRIGQRVRRVYA